MADVWKEIAQQIASELKALPQQKLAQVMLPSEQVRLEVGKSPGKCSWCSGRGGRHCTCA